MSGQQIKNDIFNVVWKACDTFRGTIDPGTYKDYILTMLFVKYLSDVRKSKLAEYHRQFKGDAIRIERAMRHERFMIEEDCTFERLYARREDPDIGQTINTVLEKIEDANKAKLHNVFRNIDFNSEANLGKARQRNERLKKLLEDFSDPKLDLSKERVGHLDIIGDVYEYLIARFASQAGKKAGEFYTPSEVSETLARLVAPQKGDRICDPTCGSGSLLIKAAQQVKDRDFSLFGQEMNGATWALCKMNMFLHEVDSARIELEDTLREPLLLEGDRLMKFDIVIANPPFSLDKWGQEMAAGDKYERFGRGIPPKGKDDVFFIDASREYDQGTNQNKLREKDMKKIVDTFHNRTVIEKYSYMATFDEIKENDFNLNIPRYVDTFEPEPEVDISAVQATIQGLEEKLAGVRGEMDGYLKELGF